ncbi:helix-turn-helix domain-containing protein [Sinomicrobium soli]|uniref:helix-turn-helix domain-containing protein n=1 Tax=Sinomicrobium sp. N-1-3-6 TaxID=2219864 RepID=UPI0011BE3C03|nr:helix-turn-helix domain-containing protein [Sinomicrobium sp. N-1-3-6]
MKRNKTNNLNTDKPFHHADSETEPGVEEILDNLKLELGLKTNKELSDLLEVRANTISTWKKRNSLDYARLIEIGRKYSIDLNRLFFNNAAETTDLRGIITVPKELQYQYVTKRDNEVFLKSLPRYRFPFQFQPGSRAFQATDMVYSFAFRGISYVIGEPVSRMDEVIFGDTYVLVNRERGIFIGRVEKEVNRPHAVNVIMNDSKIMLSKVGMPEDEIIEIWKATNIIFQDFID